MSGPFYNNIKGTTAGAAGTGAFTPNAASSDALAWSTVPTGWCGLVRYEDGTAWGLQYSHWNGTTLSRSTTQDVSSSTGSPLSLTSAATAAMVPDANRLAPDSISHPARGIIPQPGTATVTSHGVVAVTLTAATTSGATVAATNYLTRQPRVSLTSVTTANGLAGLSFGTTAFATTSSTARMGGFAYDARFGCSVLPTGPRLFVGWTGATFIGQTIEPSAFVQNYAVLAKDSTDTNLQFLTNSNVSTGTKIDTGIPLVANAWYEVRIWSNPGSLTVYMLLIRWDTGDIYYGSTATDVPVTDAVLTVNLVGGLSATTGTGIVLQPGHLLTRTAF